MKAKIIYEENKNFPWIAKDDEGYTIQAYGESIACKTREEAINLAKAEGYEIL